MRKFRVLCLAFILAFAGVMFASCKKDEDILSEAITLSETEIELSLGESIDVFVTITPENVKQKEFEIVGDYLDVAEIDCDYENMKIIITARDFIVAGITEANIGVRTVDEAEKEAHLTITLVEEHQRLETPTNISYDGQNIVWDLIDGSRNYTFQVNDKEYAWSTNSFFLDLDEFAGETINVRVKANGLSSNLDSNFSEYKVFKILPRPIGVAYSNQTKILTWNAVEDAETYTVQINNRQFITNENELEIGDYLLEAGQYQIRVRANTNSQGNILNSAFSNSVIVTKLTAPTDVNILNGRAIWSTVNGAVAYEVVYTYSQDGQSKTENAVVSSTIFTLKTDIDAGTCNIKVRAIGNEKTTLSSDFGIERNYTKLATVQNLRVENGSVVWDANSYATSYTVYFENIFSEDGSVIADTISQTTGADKISYDVSNYPAGEYRIDVVANGLNDKISSDKTGNPITVVKLAVPKNFQINKLNGESIIQWDATPNASMYRVIVNHYEEGGAYVEIEGEEDYVTVKRRITGGLSVGTNYINVKAIGGGYKNGVWYINSDYTNDATIVKLAIPTINMSDAINGNISWTSSNSVGFESYTVLIYSSSGVYINDATVSQNNYSLDELSEGDYLFTVRANAKDNSSYYSSDFANFVQIHKFGVETISVQNGTIQDLEPSDENNYTYNYYVAGKTTPVTSINSYVNNYMTSGATLSVYAVKVPKQAVVNDVYYVSSNNSNVLYIQKLPTVDDMSISDGILRYGSSYEGKSGFKFNIIVNDDEIIENATNTTYDFNSYDAGDYSVVINSVSVQEGSGTDSSLLNPLFINSYTSTNPITFKKLASPTNLKVVNYVNDQDVSALALLSAITRYDENSTGVLSWEGVNFATEYELNFDNGLAIIKTSKSYASLQNSVVTPGVHSVKIRALGNGTNIITSEYATEDEEVQSVTFTKLSSPTSLIVEDGKIKWAYENQNDDPNRNASLFADGTSIAVYFLIDDAGKIYNTVDISDLDFENNPSSSISALISRLRSNECDLPEGINGTATLKVFSLPLNSYISNAFNFTASANSEDQRYTISDYSVGVNLVGLETPMNFKIENNTISWSGLRYNVDNQTKPLKEYEITIRRGTTKYVFSVREDSTKTYEIDTAEKVIYIDDLSNSNNCYWIFNKQNFENFFGVNTYSSGNYSVAIRSIANSSTSYTDDGGIVYYYCDGYQSTALNVEVLTNPVLRVEDGVITWDSVTNAECYHLYISQTANITKNSNYIIVSKNKVNFVLGTYYSAGTYYVNIVSVGNESEVFSADFDNSLERLFIKLDTITGLCIENGILKYYANSIIGTTNNSKLYHYTMFIRQSGQDENNDVMIDNERYITYELGSNFAGGKSYMIRVQATGDNTIYLNSDLSEYYQTQSSSAPTKLISPVKAYVQNGLIYWSVVSNAAKYKITISGQRNFTINTIDNFYDISDIPAGIYSVNIKAIGDMNYLNSNVTELTNVVKLSDITNLQIENGYIVWDSVAGSNYVANINGTDVALANTEAFVDNGKMYYALDGYETGSYEIYLYNFGGNNSISSSKTSTYTFVKLQSPTNLRVEFDETENDDCLFFETVSNAQNYYLNVISRLVTGNEVLVQIKSINSSAITTGKVNFVDIVNYVNDELLMQDITDEIVSYKISVLSVGSTGELSNLPSNYVLSNDSSQLIVTKPAKTVLTAIYNSNDKFTGKITWQESENADYYKVFVKCNETVANSTLFEYSKELSSNMEGYKAYKVIGTQANLVNSGTYSIIVVACQNKNGYDSENSNQINAEFSIFGADEDGKTNPYSISTIEQFNSMQYNLGASYKLANSISNFEITELETIGSPNEMFNGIFDGNGKTITLNIDQENNTFIGMFAYVGQNGQIKNFDIDANISSITQISGKIYATTVAGINYGQISNIKVSGIISTTYNLKGVTIYNAGLVCENYGTISTVLSKASVLPQNNADYVYAGGIVAINKGTVEKSGFVGVAEAQMVGGIASQNIGGNIDQCYYQNSKDSLMSTQINSVNNGNSHNYAGGLVGYMENGKITSSYVNAKVFGASYGSSSANSAYVGGLVGYISCRSASDDGISGCYVIGFANSQIQIDAVGTYSNVGVFVGDNNINSNQGNLICVKANNQSYIGNTSRPFDDATNVTTIAGNIEFLGESANYFNTNAELKNAIYEL